MNPWIMGTIVSFQFRNEQFFARSRKSRETFEKRDIFLSGKEGKNFNRRNTLCISRITIRSLTPHYEKMTVLQRSQGVARMRTLGTSHKQARRLVSLRLIDADSAVQPSQPVLWRSRLVAKKATMAKSAIAEKGHFWMETRLET